MYQMNLWKIAKKCAVGAWLALASCHVFAESGVVKGQVEYIRTHDGNAHPDWAPPRFWFTLKGVTQAGNCPAWYGSVLFVANDKQALSMVLTASSNGQEIAAHFDGAQANGWCTVRWITMGNPAPWH